jgi:hypothetical protein
VNENLDLAARAVQEVLPAVEDFAEATGLTGPVRELAGWLTDLIRYRRAPHQAKLLIDAAAKIRASGLPSCAVSDKFLRAVLESGSLEDDLSMQTRWASLLANACTDPNTAQRVAFAEVLRQLEPIEAQMLDRLVEAWAPFGDAARVGESSAYYTLEHASSQVQNEIGISDDGLDNLERLGLIRFAAKNSPTIKDMEELSALLRALVVPTAFGIGFVRACRIPDQKPNG